MVESEFEKFAKELFRYTFWKLKLLVFPIFITFKDGLQIYDLLKIFFIDFEFYFLRCLYLILFILGIKSLRFHQLDIV